MALSSYTINDDLTVTCTLDVTEYNVAPKYKNGELVALTEAEAERWITAANNLGVATDEERAYQELRTRRDQKLEECDWITMKSYSQGVAVPEAWATYQQALRDITDQTPSFDSEGNLTGITWPEKPE